MTHPCVKHFCTKKKGMGSAVCVRGWICAISLSKGGCTVHGYRNVTSNPLIFVPIHVSG